ncbi:MAG: biotin carboxylase N-terminal domain-containing protein [Anaerolineales bacterium]|nr:biotin carboxylase N-terminal domain-containing protein [Anaerolineales bacterium]
MKLLIANRGEIAVRIIRACQELDIPTVAVYSEADRSALHTRYADEALPIGPTPAAESYLNMERLLEAASKTSATAVHPGYGFLSENPDFGRAVEEAGLTFIGPRPETMAELGDKLSARKAARRANLPVLPGSDIPLSQDLVLERIEPDLEYPVLVKAASGGGGRGIRLARSAEELIDVVDSAREEAKAAFGDATIYLEPLVQKARHIEVQILGDGRGKVLTFGERECSIQRRHQKLIEEAPAPDISPAERECIHQDAKRLGESLHYRSLGTVEFLRGEDGRFHFIEVNPRIQVEHPVTEMITGLDLVKEQIKLAVSGELNLAQQDIRFQGAAIEARVLAEDPEDHFLPTSGNISYLKEPGGPGIRVDSSLYQGITITADYDSLLAKVIAWGENRQAAIKRLHRALQEVQIGGLKTDVAFLRQVIDSHPYQTGNIDTSFLDQIQLSDREPEESVTRDAALAAALHIHRKRRNGNRIDRSRRDPWQQQAWREQLATR